MASHDRDALTEQARALGDPTRNAIFRYVDDARRPVGVAELTEHFGLNHNAIRQHLAKLRDVGLVVEELAEPAGPGRPALLYRPNPGAAGRWESGSPYEQLASLLIELLQTGDGPRTVGRAAGRRLAKAARGERDRVRLLEALTRRLGFEPRVVERRRARRSCSTGVRSWRRPRRRPRSSASCIGDWRRASSSQIPTAPRCAIWWSGRRHVRAVASCSTWTDLPQTTSPRPPSTIKVEPLA